MKNLLICTLLLFAFSCSKSVERKTILNIIEKYNSSRTETPYVSKVFFSEYTKQGSNYISFNDGVYYFLYYGDNYKYERDNSLLISDNIRKATSKEEYVFNTKNLTDKYHEPKSESLDPNNISELSDIPFGLDVYGIIRNLETRGPLSKKYSKQFEYKIDSSDNTSSIHFKPLDINSSLNGTIFYNNTSFCIDSIIVASNEFESVINDYAPVICNIVFEKDGKIRGIKVISNPGDMNITRNLKFIASSQKDIDIAKFNIDVITYFRNALILYDDSALNNYSSYFEDEYSAIFDSFGGADKVKEDFASKQNTLSIYRNFQNKTESFENSLKSADSLARCVLDSVYGVKRLPYKYKEAIRSAEREYKNTELKLINRVVDLGSIKSDSIATAEYKIVNLGEEQLYLYDIKTDGKNTTYSLNRNGVNPADTITLTLKYDINGKTGKTGATATFSANTQEKLYKLSLLLDIKNN